jgi:hypothetical protein
MNNFKIEKIKDRNIYRLYDVRTAAMQGLYFKIEDTHWIFGELLNIIQKHPNE